MKFPSDYVLFAGPNDEQAIEDAKKYINDNGYTKNEVKLVIVGGQVQVRTK